MAYAAHLKCADVQTSCGFESRTRYYASVAELVDALDLDSSE